MGQLAASWGESALPQCDLVLRPELLHAVFKLSLNGERFVSDPETPLADGDVLLLLSADVGADRASPGYFGRYLRIDPRPGRDGLRSARGCRSRGGFLGGVGFGGVDPGS